MQIYRILTTQSEQTDQIASLTVQYYTSKDQMGLMYSVNSMNEIVRWHSVVKVELEPDQLPKAPTETMSPFHS